MSISKLRAMYLETNLFLGVRATPIVKFYISLPVKSSVKTLKKRYI